MAHGVRADALGGERCLVRGRDRDVALEDRDYAEAGDPLTVGVEEEGRVWMVLVIASAEIRTKCVRSLLPERTGALLAPFSKNTHLGRSLETQILDVQVHGLGSTRAGVVQEGEQREVAWTETVRGGRCSQQRLDLVPIEIGHGARRGLLDRDVQDATAEFGL
jgi:hypothetical protein